MENLNLGRDLLLLGTLLRQRFKTGWVLPHYTSNLFLIENVWNIQKKVGFMVLGTFPRVPEFCTYL